MLLRINEKRSPNPRNSSAPGTRRLACVPLLFLIAFCSPTCRTAKSERSPGVPEGLQPLMTQMRLLSRDFKRALLLEDRDQYAPLAQALLERTRELRTFGGPEDFAGRVEDLIRGGERLRQALPDAGRDRIDALFGTMMETCMACHFKYRPE